MQSSTAAQQIVAELLQYAACLGEQGGGGGGDLEVGQGFQKTSAVPSQDLLSCLGSLPPSNCFSLCAHTHPANPLLGQSHTWGGYTQGRSQL